MTLKVLEDGKFNEEVLFKGWQFNTKIWNTNFVVWILAQILSQFKYFYLILNIRKIMMILCVYI